jgi:NAD(P)-dependent dehydrogenase (short-subunit alcohol dehydrogenase family)
MAQEGRIAIVTGGGSGVGRAVSHALCAGGWTVVVAGRRLDPRAETNATASHPDRVETHAADVSDDAAVDDLFDTVIRRHGHLDLLFNNAGINVPGTPLDELKAEDLRSIIAINLLGSMFCARAAFRVMKAQSPQGGRIINNGSVSAYAPRAHSAPYTATKHAISGLTKSLILDGRPFNIACGQIDIGNASTDMSAYMAKGAIQADGTMKAEPRIPVSHVGDAVLHMANLPLDANIPFMTVMASAMPLYGRG